MMYSRATLWDMINATSSQALEAGRLHSGKLDGTNQCGQDHVRANHFPMLESKKGLQTSGTSGQCGTGSFLNASLQSYLESRLRATMQKTGSTLYALTLKEWVTKGGHRLPRLAATGRRISDSGCTGWPTARAVGNYHGNADRDKGPNGRLEDVVPLAGWPTPLADMRDDRIVPEGMVEKRKEAKGLISLALIASLTGWNSPSARDWKDSEGMSVQRQDGRSRMDRLPMQAMFLSQPMRLTASGQILTGSGVGIKDGGRLNPSLPRWLMGFPVAWCVAAINAARTFVPSKKDSRGTAMR